MDEIKDNKIRMLYYDAAIKNNTNIKEKMKFEEEYYNKQKNLAGMEVFKSHIKLRKDEIDKKKIITTLTIFSIK